MYREKLSSTLFMSPLTDPGHPVLLLIGTEIQRKSWAFGGGKLIEKTLPHTQLTAQETYMRLKGRSTNHSFPKTPKEMI
jgi:hypothetical protein